MPSQNDIWRRKGPNTDWQTLENQRLIDEPKLRSSLLDQGGIVSDNEEEDLHIPENISGAKACNNQAEAQICGNENEAEVSDDPEGVSFNAPLVVGQERAKSQVIAYDQLTSSRFQSMLAGIPNHGYVRQENTVIERFLEATQDQGLCPHPDSIARLRRFFQTVSLDDLEGDARHFGKGRILLEDRNFSRKTFRQYPRTMTPKQLYDALRKQRYTVTAASNTATSEPMLWTKSDDCQVERRTIYMSNPNRFCALVLATTAISTEAPILFDFIDRFLRFETSISVATNLYHTSTNMTMSFHLPFYTFRERPYTDCRQDHEGLPLRKYAKIPDMNPEWSWSFGNSQKLGWLHESQISLLVSISNADDWTAYLFEDTYYKPSEPTAYWDSFCSKAGYYYPDALTSGKLDSTRYLEPRMYFLRVIEARIDQSYREWRCVVDTLEEIAKRHRPGRIFTQSTGLKSRWNRKHNQQIILRQKYSEWISNMNAVVSDQSSQMSSTLIAWKDFEDRCSKYFPNEISSPLETSIGHTFSMIKMLRDRLDGLSQELAGDRSALAAQLESENTWTARFMNTLAVRGADMISIIVEVALFTIQSGFNPFQMDFLSFVKLEFFLIVFSWVIWMVFLKLTSFQFHLGSTGTVLNSLFRTFLKATSKPVNGEEGEQVLSFRTDVEQGKYQDRIRSPVDPRLHARAHHVADFSRSTSRTRGLNIESSGGVAIEGQAFSVRVTPRVAAAGFTDRFLDGQRVPRPQDQKSQVRIDAYNISGKHSQSTSMMGPIFARLHAQWSGAETAEARLELLESLGRHSPIAIPEATSVGSTWKGWLRCAWELPAVVQQLQESGSSDIQTLLGDFITITGSLGGMECSTCSQFLKKTWGKPGIMALEVLGQGVALLDRSSTASSSTTTGEDLEIYASRTHIIIGVKGYEEDVQSLIDSIVWICTAVRVNPRRQADFSYRSPLRMSKASQLMFLESTQPELLVYGLADLTECSDGDLGPQAKCWTGLFRSGIVAFHSCERSWGSGLEISFDMMIHLSGVENVYNIEEGLIFVGFSTALVPTFYDETTKSVQWHFEETNGMSGEMLRHLPSIRGGWYKTQDVNLLRKSKCFVGWFARANILLGTRELIMDSQNKLNWSIDTKEQLQSVHKEGLGANGQFGFTVGPINTALQLVKTWRFHSNIQHFHRHEQYGIAVRLCYGNVAIVIDTDSKQVWLVPMLSLVLHLCHRYFQEINCGGYADDPLPFANPSPDGALEAARVLESSGHILVSGVAGDTDAEHLRQLFLRLNTNLLNAQGTREQSNKKTLFASELMAMVTEPGRGSPLKKIKALADAESWIGLLERVDFVGVCANIGRLIEPQTPSTNVCTCSILPSDRYLLAAHMHCLKALSQRVGENVRNSRVWRLGEKVFWHMEKLYWMTCLVGKHKSIWNQEERFLQQISSKEKGKSRVVQGVNSLAVPQQHIPEDGVVAFGGDLSKGLLQSLRWEKDR